MELMSLLYYTKKPIHLRLASAGVCGINDKANKLAYSKGLKRSLPSSVRLPNSVRLKRSLPSSFNPYLVAYLVV